MGGLLGTLLNSTGALRAFQQALTVVQNNVTNANTPGYVKQRQSLESMPFDPTTGLTGGVVAGSLISSRSEYLEQNVQRQQQLLGYYQQQATDLAQVENQFDLTSQFGIPDALDQFFQSFSQLSVNPNDSIGRQSVIDGANQVAQAFNQAAMNLSSVSTNVDRETTDSVNTINRMISHLRDINSEIRKDSRTIGDPGIDADIHSTLEELSQYGDFTVLKQQDGTYSLFIGGQTALLIGDHQIAIQADFSAPQTAILDPQGHDITNQIHSGSLGALLGEKNQTLSSYMSDLNTLAQTFADEVNNGLASGVDANGAMPTVNLFSYDATVGAAFTLGVTSITPDQIAAALPSAPGGNGNALALADLASAKVVNGYTFTEAYGNLGARVGRDVLNAQQSQDTQKNLLTQAQSLRASVSSVDLNEEAATLLQFQQSFQAVSKLVTVLDELSTTLIDMIPT